MSANVRLWFSTAQAAEYAGKHVDTIRKACESGELHGGQRTKNGRWAIRRECLDAWLDAKPCEHQKAAA
jgi:excisionase family DNA binding protein